MQSSVQVVAVDPENSLAIYNSAGELVAHLSLPPDGGRRMVNLWLPSSSFMPNADPATGKSVPGLQFDLSDESGADLSLDWDGLSDRGMPVSSGSYTAQLIYNSPAGSKTIITRSFIVLRSRDQADFAGALAAPNPALGGQDLVVFYPLCPPYGAHASLYTLQGERVAQSDDPAQTGRLSFRTAGMASGVYLVRLERTAASAAIVAQAGLKVAFVH
jgi:hypothetical protein